MLNCASPQVSWGRDLPNGFGSSWCIDGQVANEESVATLSIAGSRTDTSDVLALAKQCILAQPNGVTCGEAAKIDSWLINHLETNLDSVASSDTVRKFTRILKNIEYAPKMCWKGRGTSKQNPRHKRDDHRQERLKFGAKAFQNKLMQCIVRILGTYMDISNHFDTFCLGSERRQYCYFGCGKCGSSSLGQHLGPTFARILNVFRQALLHLSWIQSPVTNWRCNFHMWTIVPSNQRAGSIVQ